MGGIPSPKETALRTLLRDLADPLAAEILLEKEAGEAEVAANRAKGAHARSLLRPEIRVTSGSRVPLPEEVDAERETREADAAWEALDRLHRRWRQAEALVAGLEDASDRDPAPPSSAAAAEAEAIERVARGLQEFEQRAKLKVNPSGSAVRLARAAKPAGKRRLPASVAGLIGAVASLFLVGGLPGPAGWAEWDRIRDGKERRKYAAHRRRIQSRVQGERERKETAALAAEIDRALPADGPAVGEVREAFRVLARAPGEAACERAEFALAVRLGVLRRGHLLARARALLAASGDGA